MNPNQVMPYQYSEPWVRPPAPLYPGPHLMNQMNNGANPQFYCDSNTNNQVANFMSYPQPVLNPFAPPVAAANQNIHPYPRRQALLQIVDPNTGKNIIEDILNSKAVEDGSSSPPSNNWLQQQGEEIRCQQNEENNLGANTQAAAQQMMMMPAQHSIAPWPPQDMCQQLQQIPDNGSPQQEAQQQQMLEPVVVQVPVVVYLRDPA